MLSDRDRQRLAAAQQRAEAQAGPDARLICLWCNQRIAPGDATTSSDGLTVHAICAAEIEPMHRGDGAKDGDSHE